MGARRKCHIIQGLKENNCQLRILYPVKYPSGKQRKLRHFQMKEIEEDLLPSNLLYQSLHKAIFS